MTGRGATGDIWEVMSTARTIRRFTDQPVDEETLMRCLEAATWAPSGANAQGWRFVVLRSPEQRAVVAKAAAKALSVIEPVYGMTRPAADDDSQRARTYRATYELHDRAGEFTSVLFAQQRFGAASELLLGGSIFPAMQNFLLAARAKGLGACMTSWRHTTARRYYATRSVCPTTGCSRATSWSAGRRVVMDRCAGGRWQRRSTTIAGTSPSPSAVSRRW